MNTEFRSALNKDWLWPLRDRKAWPYLTREENLTFPKTISNLIENKRTVIQAGGHCGLYPYQYSNLFEKVYTFEPEFTNFQCLTENVKGLENVNVFNFLVLDNVVNYKTLIIKLKPYFKEVLRVNKWNN